MKKLLGLLALVFGLAIVPEAGAQSNTVRNMTENTSPATTYFLYCVHPSATPGDYKCTIANVLDTAIGSESKFEAIMGSDIVLEGEASVVTPAMLTTIDSPADNECYSYDSATATGEWVSCGGGGGGIVDVEEEDVTVTSSGSVIDFGAGFDITDSPSGEANIVLDLTEDQVDLSTETTGLLPFASLAGTEAQLEGVVSDISNILTDSENAATATALAANGANCSSGNYPLGVDASGAVESCAADDDVPEAGDFAAATDLDANGAIVTDAIGTAELDDDANTPVAAYFVVVETGAVSFDYLAELDSTHIADDAILAGDMGADDFGDWTCSAGNETCVLDSGVVDSVAIENRGIKGGDIALVVVDTEHLAAGAVDSTKIENRGIKGGDIALVVVDTEHLVAGAVDSTKIENRGIKAGDIALDIIAAEHMADEDHGDVSWTSGVSDVDESIFQDGGSDEIAVTAGMMNTGTSAAATTVWAGDNTWTQIDSTHILNGGILTGDMGSSDFGDFTCDGNNAGCTLDVGTVSTSEIATNGVDSDEIAADAVDRSELDDDFAAATIVDGGANPDTLRFTWSSAFNWVVTLDEDTFVETPTSLSEGWGAIRVCQPAGGNLALVTYDSEYNDSPPIHEGANECTILSLASYDGTNIDVMSNRPETCEPVVIGAKATDLATTDSTTFHIPAQYTLTNLFAYTELVDPTGAAISIDIRDNHATSLLSTNLTIDATEDGSDTAATPFVFAADHTVAAHNSITVDVQQVGSTLAGQELTTYVCYVD